MTTNPQPRVLARPYHPLLIALILLTLVLVAYTIPMVMSPSTSGVGPIRVEAGGEPASEPNAAPAVIAPVERDEEAAPAAANRLNAGRDRGSGSITGGPLTGPGLGVKDGTDSACPGHKECAP